MTNFGGEKKNGSKKAIYQKKIQLGFSSKIKVPQLDPARAGKISARTHHYSIYRGGVSCFFSGLSVGVEGSTAGPGL